MIGANPGELPHRIDWMSGLKVPHYRILHQAIVSTQAPKVSWTFNLFSLRVYLQYKNIADENNQLMFVGPCYWAECLVWLLR